ncbi:MAG TPA: helix-turn-helix transcriptional regulator, partial [Polyangiaceae bacterium]|nr:helix-turn-helix transcriptional regulator [Polyangiaceae bacterium]
MKDDELAARLARNLRQLRAARGLTQSQLARLAGLPRATWTHLESGDANPTLAVLNRAADALQVSVEELISTPRAACAHYPQGSLPSRVRGAVVVRTL